MSVLSRLDPWRRQLPSSAILALVALVAVAALFAGRGSTFDPERTAVPVPVPIYSIEARSGSHTATILNLPLPYVGAPQVPIPVDINGDLLPDVTAAVNLINAQGIFNNPPNTGELIAPNVEYTRLLTAPIITPGNLPLRINVKLTLVDLEGGPQTIVRFGYDTGEGGAIPPKYKAVLGGIENSFNPLVAKIDTVGGVAIGLDPRLPDLGLSPLGPAYSGPLTSFAAFDAAPTRATVDMRFGPMPDLVEVTYESQDDGTQAFSYAHSELGEVDLDITGHIENDDDDTIIDAQARLHRLPRQVSLALRNEEGDGAVIYDSETASGRLPDLSASLVLQDPEQEQPLRARVDAESLPDSMSALWTLVPGEAPEIDFIGSGQGIGAIEARIQNFEGAPTAFEEWVPDEQQYMNIQAGPGGVLIDDTLITARLERIRSASVHTTEEGSIQGNVQVGSGERPLQVHGELDLRQPPPPPPDEEPADPGPFIDATATISPLPDEIDFAITPAAEDEGGPMRILYTPSDTIDVDTTARVILPEYEGDLACGEPGTVCAEVGIRNVPTHIEARVYNLPGDTRIEVDAIPREGATALDVFASGTVGPIEDLDEPIAQALAAPVHAEVNVRGLPRFLRFRLLENDAQDLQRIDVRTCDLNYVTNVCAAGTDDQVAELDFAVRNWDERPDGLPAPPESGPIYLTATAQGLADTNDLVHYEATGRMTKFRQATLLKTADLLASRVDIGSGQDFRVYVDADDVDLNGGSPTDGRVSLDGDIQISPLPTPLTFCVAQPGHVIPAEPLDAQLTAACEDTNPFGDATIGTGDAGPLALAYRVGANNATPFDIVADVEARGDFPFVQPDLPVEFGRFDRMGAHLSLTDIPGNFTAFVATPGETAFDLPGDAEASGTRIRTVAPGADLTRLELGVKATTPGVECEDPDPNAVAGVAGAVCANLVIDGLPEYTSTLFSTTTSADATDDSAIEQRFESYACDFQFFAAAPACGADTTGSIGLIEAFARAHAGVPDGIQPFAPPAADQPHVIAQADIDDLSNFEVEARLRIETLESITYRQNPDRTEVSAHVGTGEPFTVHGEADLRDADDLLDDKYLLDGRVDLVLNPLPTDFSYVQTGPGADQTDPMHFDITSSDDVELTVDAELRHVDGGPNCGDPSTICAGLHVDKIPAHIIGDLTRVSGAVDMQNRERISTTDLRLHLDPHAANDPKPNITINAALGTPTSVPVIGGLPLFADLELRGVPLDISVDLDSREVIMGSVGSPEVRSSNVERFQFHACKLLANGSCDPTTLGKIDLIEGSARTFDIRPVDFPAPPAQPLPLGSDPDIAANQISLAGRGDNVEAYFHIPAIREVQFLNQNGVIAASADIGGGTPSSPQNLAINVDVVDLAVAESLPLGGVDYKDPLLDVKTAVTIKPFPGSLAFCLREGGLVPVPPATGVDFAAACEDTDPFDIGSSLTETPLSFGLDAEGTTFAVDVTADFSVDGDTVAGAGGTALPTTRIVGDLDLGNVPDELQFHFLQPRTVVVPNSGGFTVEPRGEYRAALRAPGATQGLDITFSGAHLVGDGAQCEDPRPTVSATCATATLSNLPTTVDFVYNPDLRLDDPGVNAGDLSTARNLRVFADSTEGGSLNVQNLHFSRVKPELQANGEPAQPLDSDAIVVDAILGDIVSYPLLVEGTIIVPEGEGELPTIDLERMGSSAPLLPQVTAHVRNYIAPNPFLDYDTKYSGTGGLPPRVVEFRNDDDATDADPNNDDPSDDNPAAYTLSVLQRGEDMRLNATIPAVRRVSARSILATDLTALGTFAVDVGFAHGFNVRAFLDMAPDQEMSIYADARIDDIPANLSMCFRGARTAAQAGKQPLTGMGTWCDSSTVGADDGAFEFVQDPGGPTTSTLDVDAFVRIQLGGGTTLISGRVDIDQIPQVVRGILPGDTLEVTAWRYQPFTNALIKDGIDRIAFEAATFDLPLDRTGYDSFIGNEDDLPFLFRPNGGLPPVNGAPADGREFIHASADIPTLAFHVRGQLGRLDGAPSSQLHRLLYSETPCQNPRFVRQANGTFAEDPNRNRVDFPHLPLETGTSHKCIAADFDGDTGANPLSLQADVDIDPETTIRLRDGGISDLPAWFQVNISDAKKFQDPVNQQGWRAPCGPASEPTLDDCMAPLLRFDQSAQADPNVQNYLFGSAEVGARDDLDKIRNVDPTTAHTLNFDAIPTATGWIGETDLTNDRGALVRLIDFPTGTDPDNLYATTRLGVSASIRLPIPQSLTVDQPQEYKKDLAERTENDNLIVGGTQASDLRIRIVVRDAFGNILNPTGANNLGDVAMYKAREDRNAELLIGAACPPTPVFDAILGVLPTAIAEFAVELFGALVCPEWQEGIGLPGELGIALYERTSYTDIGGDKLRTSKFFQIDGRLSSSISAAVRMRDAAGDIPSLAASVYDVPGFADGVEPDDPSEPTFRLRAELVGDDSMPKDGEAKDDSSTHTPPPEQPALDFVITTEFALGGIKADFDFKPTSDPTARQVDAVIYTNVSDLNVGVDIRSFAGIGENSGPAEIDAHVSAQIDHLRVDGKTVWNLPIDDILEFIPNWIITNLIPGDSWVEKALTWLVSAISDAISALINGALNLFPFQLFLEGAIDVNLSLNEIDQFTYRQSLLRGYADTHGDGDADIGSINMFMDSLMAGLTFDIPEIPLPTALINDLIDALECVFTLGFSCDDDEFIPESINPDPVLLIGWGFQPIGHNFTPFLPVLLDFRSCNLTGNGVVDFLGSIVPFAAGINGINVDGDDGPEEFAIWPGTDPRIAISGVLPTVVPGLGTVAAVLDVIVQVIVGPILCLGFDADAAKFQGANYAGDSTSYNPGGIAASDFFTPDPNDDIDEGFAGHPVPGQPGESLFQPPASDLPADANQQPPPDVQSTPTVPTPPAATALPPLYTGTTGAVIGSDIAMCGVHEFDTLTISGNITVAQSANPALVDGRAACAVADVGALEFRANSLAVTGTINGDSASGDVGVIGSDAAKTPFRATGSSGGSNAGSGYDGSAVSAGLPYTADNSAADQHVTAGGPGSEIPAGYAYDNAVYPHNEAVVPLLSNGDPGRGGGVIRLRADTLLLLEGDLSADGGDATGGSLAGLCDADPDDNGQDGLQQQPHVDDDGDPDTPSDNDDGDPDTTDTQLDNPRLDPPINGAPSAGQEWEHTGTVGAGGGAGGGILLEARVRVQVLATGDLQAEGGNGTDGRLGAGGGGGGGVIRVTAPIVEGISEADVDGETHAGLNGNLSAPACEDVPAPTQNTYDSPDTPAVETANLPEDGFGRIVSRPYARLEAYGPFWWKGNTDFTGYITGGGAPNNVQVVACAVVLPDSGSDSIPQIAQQAGALLPTVGNGGTVVGTLPHPGEPCGARPGTTIQQVNADPSNVKTFTGAVEPPSAASQIALRGTTTGYYAMYTTALRPRTAGNNCLSTADDTSFDPDISDATDCEVEPINGIEWVVGIDSTAPAVPDNVTILDPDANGIIDVAQVTPTFTATDSESGVTLTSGGNVRGQCRVRHTGSGGPVDPDFTSCVSNQAFAVPPPGGNKTLDVRVADGVGNVSVVRMKTFNYSAEFPEVTATRDGGTVGNAGWYTSAPEIDFTNYVSSTPPASSNEYAYQFDNGLEGFCNSGGDDVTAPYADRNCTIPASEVGNLVPGEHVLRYSAIDASGRRYSGEDMHELAVKIDNKGPLVEITPVGLPDTVLGSTPYYSYQPRVFVSAIDQFGASGVDDIEYRFGGPVGTYLPFDPANPPLLPPGETVVCGRATDVAGNPGDNDLDPDNGLDPACATLNVDFQAPTLDFTVSSPEPMSGWYTTAPSFTVSNYDDLPNPGGVGAAEDHFRVRYDNEGYTDCNSAGCTIPASSFGSGRHLAEASAADRFDNRSPEKWFEIFVDLEDPRVVPIISPRDPDGANGWWHTNPYLTLFGDDGDGSGIATLEYTLDGTIDDAPPPGPMTPWTEPVLVGAGNRELCWRATDKAGRSSAVECQPLQVDLDDPTADATAPAPPFNGWHGAPVTATSSAADASPGSGLGSSALANLCTELLPEGVAPSGRCISVDGGPYVPIAGSVTGSVGLGEGDHVVRTFSIDRSGRRSAVDEQIVRIDMSRPVVAVRRLPPDPAQAGWYRYEPYVVLRATDGRDGSGIIPGSFEYRIDSGAFQDYREPFRILETSLVNRTIDVRASDFVGTRNSSTQLKVDNTPPTLTATTPTHLIWLRLLGLGAPPSIGLRYTVGDNLSGPVRTWLVITDVTGMPVRVFDGGITNVVPGAAPVERSVQWDGKTGALTGLVPLGIYYYRVYGVDEAGNWAQSGESQRITIKLL